MEKLYSYISGMSQDLPVEVLALNFILCFTFSYLLSFYYVKWKAVELGGDLNAEILLYAPLVTFLVVSVIQSSLMLSLGMVGALSVIRFRTPLKDPLDLVYLYFAISIGIAFASAKTVTSIFLISAIFVIILVAGKLKKHRVPARNHGTLILEYVSLDEGAADRLLKSLGGGAIRRYDRKDNLLSVYLDVDVNEVDNVLSSVQEHKANLKSRVFSSKLSN